MIATDWTKAQKIPNLHATLLSLLFAAALCSHMSVGFCLIFVHVDDQNLTRFFRQKVVHMTKIHEVFPTEPRTYTQNVRTVFDNTLHVWQKYPKSFRLNLVHVRKMPEVYNKPLKCDSSSFEGFCYVHALCIWQKYPKFFRQKRVHNDNENMQCFR